MEIVITKSPALRNDLLITIPHEELDTVRFHIANRAAFMQLPGLLRGPDHQDDAQRTRVKKLKEPVEEHFRSLTDDSAAGLVDETGNPLRRVIAIGSRNTGNNRDFQAWQHDLTPKHFIIRGDRPQTAPVPLLSLDRNGDFRARDLIINQDAVLEDRQDVSAEIDWCIFANCVLRRNRIIPVEEIAHQFYDIGHLIAANRETPEGKEIWREFYDGFDLRSRETIVRVMRERRLPRNRYLHNAVGLSCENIFILQREGTPEEMASWLREAGAEDGFILDNGGSVFCWAWWLDPSGGYLFHAPDFRPPSSAILAFVLHGTPYTRLSGGSVSYTVL